MGATYDPELLGRTFEFIETKARDQDLIFYFHGLSINLKMGKSLTEYFKKQYDVVSFVESLNRGAGIMFGRF